MSGATACAVWPTNRQRHTSVEVNGSGWGWLKLPLQYQPRSECWLARPASSEVQNAAGSLAPRGPSRVCTGVGLPCGGRDGDGDREGDGDADGEGDGAGEVDRATAGGGARARSARTA